MEGTIRKFHFRNPQSSPISSAWKFNRDTASYGALKLTVPPTGLIHPSPSSRIDHFPNTIYIYIYRSCTCISCQNKTHEIWTTMAFVSSCSFEDFAWVERKREREIEWMLFLLSFKNWRYWNLVNRYLFHARGHYCYKIIELSLHD